MTLDFLCNGRCLHLNFDVTSCDFHHHVTSVKAVITILPREVITVRSLRAELTLFRYFRTSGLLSHMIVKMAHTAQKGKLIAVIGDEDTCTGFLLGGIGEINKKREPNFLVVNKNTSVMEIEEMFRNFVKRPDIAIILINQNIAEMIRHVIDTYTDPIPAVLEIPSKECPYDASKDSILRRAKGMFSAEDFR